MEDKRKIFISFLKRNNIFESFKENFIECHNDIGMFNNIRINEFTISSAFSWSKTPEGYAYWSEISCLWSNYCDKIDLMEYYT